MSGKKVGSDGQVRNTTAGWAADTKTYPEGMRLMDTDTGGVRISKGTTYALAWVSAPVDGDFMPLSGGTFTGSVALANDATSGLQPTTFQQVEQYINDLDNAKADASKVPTVLDVTVSGTTMTGVNQFGNTFTVDDSATGQRAITANSGTPFTANKTFISAIATSADVLHITIDLVNATGIKVYFYDNASAATDPSGPWFLQVRVYP